MDLLSILNRIENLCKEKNLIRQNVYIDCGVGKNFGVSMRNGSEPSIGKMTVLADYLGCSVDYLLGRTNNPHSHKIEGDVTFYHVSSHICENYILKKENKPYPDLCNLICESDVSTISKCKDLLKKIKQLNPDEEINRPNGKWLCEAIFEYVRKTEYPQYPSRVWGVFVTRTYKDAEEFNFEARKGRANIFEIVQPIENVFEFDMQLFSLACDPMVKPGLNDITINDAFNYAKLYWSREKGKEKPQLEYIIDGAHDIQVGRQINWQATLSADERRTLDLFLKLDDFDRGCIAERIEIMLESEKYSQDRLSGEKAM